MPGIPTGTKFFCTVCKSEFIATKGGDAKLSCCGKPVEKK
ncbi:MAG: desulfoferrodoxin [SAR202 cluster bacterium]|nr:desulfoferrodoxin [SAR202 cluster bacterium]